MSLPKLDRLTSIFCQRRMTAGYSDCPHCDRKFFSKIGFELHLESHSYKYFNGQTETSDGKTKDCEGKKYGFIGQDQSNEVQHKDLIGKTEDQNKELEGQTQAFEGQSEDLDERTHDFEGKSKGYEGHSKDMEGSKSTLQRKLNYKCNTLKRSNVFNGNVSLKSLEQQEVKEAIQADGEDISEKDVQIGEEIVDSVDDGRSMAKEDGKISKKVSFSCKICRKSFSSKKNLSLHEQVVHDKLKPFKCKLCTESFAYPYQLTDHRQKVH